MLNPFGLIDIFLFGFPPKIRSGLSIQQYLFISITFDKCNGWWFNTFVGF